MLVVAQWNLPDVGIRIWVYGLNGACWCSQKAHALFGPKEKNHNTQKFVFRPSASRSRIDLMVSRVHRCCRCCGGPPPPLADPPGWLPPPPKLHAMTQGTLWSHVCVVVVEDPPPPQPPPPALRDGWLGRSASTLTKRTCYSMAEYDRHTHNSKQVEWLSKLRDVSCF